jgi:hypothetical protein
VVEGSESCDLGTTNNGACPKTCSNSCTVNNCNSICGNGVVEGSESCDLGTTNNGACPKTCSSSCTINACYRTCNISGQCISVPGYGINECSPVGSSCGGSVCNNGVIEGLEECDDGANNGNWPKTCSTHCILNTNPISCGSADGDDFSSAPTTNLCNGITATPITGQGPWFWYCGPYECKAGIDITIIDASCGPANGHPYVSEPAGTLLCSDEIPVSFTSSGVNGTGPWVWNCGTSTCSTKGYPNWVEN